jgi:hypothetical protein
MSTPKRIADITLDDLSRHRWCYFHDDEGGFDSFEWVIPDTHPKFDTDVIELELATFRFQSGHEFLGMFDGSNCFSICLADEWFSFWTGIRKPTEQEKLHLANAMSQLGLTVPIEATAKWSGTSERYRGIRYLNEAGALVDA